MPFYESGYYAAIEYQPETDSNRGIVIDMAGNVYRSDPLDDVKYITVYNDEIREFI